MCRTRAFSRIFAVLLAMTMVLGYFPGVTVPAGALTQVYGGLGVKQADPATVNNWKNYMGQLDTSLAGGVWTDKSVFESAEDYFAATDENEDFNLTLGSARNFMLSLSAMASTKTIVGYSTLPTDTMFVLDISGSMDDSSNRDARMVEAANKAIGDLLALNNYNRVGVVLYASDATLLLPLDRYTTTSTTTYNNEVIPSYIRLTNNDEVTTSNGLRDYNGRRPSGSREVVGATYIQDGIYLGMEQLTDPDLDTVITSGFQAGTTRTPIMVLMSDGAPTYAINTYTDIDTHNMGNGQATSTTPDMAFVTQLTAAWAKEKIGQKYGDETEPLFYTLGLGVGSNSYALSVMDPLNSGANDDVDEYWDAFGALDEGETLNLENHSYRYGWNGWRYRQVTKLNDGVNDGTDNLPLSQNYVDEYFAAGTSNELSTAFQSIVDTIILQTLYYPTQVEGNVDLSGYLELTDYVGPNMEVKHVAGVQLGDTLYTGERLAELVATGMGTIENPTEAGNELVWSVISRLGMGETGDPQATQKARDLLQKAWEAGQLAYNVDYDGTVTWSNQICWYADADGSYLGFWDGDGIDEEMKGVAAYAIRSYGFLGDVGSGHRTTDMLYATFQVRTSLDENGDVIEDVIYCKLPASLVPLVEYNVELNSNDPATATEITLTLTGADAPIRFLCEIGLRGEIDLLDMEGTAVENLRTDENGNFIFYTNQWDVGGMEEGEDPSKHHNAYVTFVPSEENERYYYHEDTPIYVRSGNSYVLYTGSKPAAGDGRTYYRAYVSYTASTNGGPAQYDVEYQVIPDQALASANVESMSGTSNWVVKKGTLYLYSARSAVAKTDNLTGTLAYSEYPIVHADAPGGYHLDAILGNNGLLTIDPPEGLKLTKQTDTTITDQGQTYSFTVELASGTHNGAQIYLITETDGVRSAWQLVQFTDSYTLELGIGDSAWLVGLPEGNQYTVTENVDGQYKVSSITVDGTAASQAALTVRKNHIADVVFTNSAVYTGDVAISKLVESTYAPHETGDYAYKFAVTVTGADPNTTYETVMVDATGTQAAGTSVTTDGSGKASFDLVLSHGEYCGILGLPEDAVVTATEELLPGFTSNHTGNTASTNVVIGETTVLNFVNTYTAAPVSPEGFVDISVRKLLDGREWKQGDSFTFLLEQHVGNGEHTAVERVTVGYDDADKLADFQSTADILYTEAGVYSYRVTEEHGELPGIAYDTAVCYFDIVVEDDGEGHLYIANVVGRQDVSVSYDQASKTWDVTTEFTNIYNANGAVQVSLSVAKDIEDEADTGISKAGFIFALYDADAQFNIGQTPRATVTTNAEGVATFRDTLFTEEGTYYFVLKELEGEVPSMTYDDTVYYCTVVITSNPETSGLKAEGVVVAGNGNEVYRETVEYDPANEIVPILAYEADFVNTYEPDAASVSVAGTKTLTGRTVKDGEFSFSLHHASLTDGGFVTGERIAQVANQGGAFRFAELAELSFSKTGYYYFAVKEDPGQLGGMTYDDRTLYVTVHVTADTEKGALIVTSVNVTDVQGDNAALEFRNTYVAEGTDTVLKATKELTGLRSLAANMFQFYLYSTGSDYTVSGDPIQTAFNQADGTVEFPLDYNTEGEYYYVITERVPTRLDSNGKLNGVKYDTSSYRVKVTVKDDLNGKLSADVAYLDGTPAFINDYTPTPTTVTLGGGKAMVGRSQIAGEFSFSLYEADSHFVPLDSKADGSATNVSGTNGQFVFTFDELRFTEPGGYRYIIKENDTGNANVNYDETVFYVLVTVTDNGRGQLVAQTAYGMAIDANGVITEPLDQIEFYNVFNHDPAELTLSGEKELVGDVWGSQAEHTFTFELYETNEEFVIIEGTPVSTVANDPSEEGEEGKFSFPVLTFSEKGTYYYVVKEQLPEGVTVESPRDESTGIVYDTSELHVTVTVTEDPANPTSLKATYTVSGHRDTLTFQNVYTVEGAVVASVSGKKVLEGRNLHADGFTFLLKDDKGVELDRVRNTGDGGSNEGTFTFAALTFTEVGTYTYTVEELEGESPGVTYSKEIYTVTVQVSDQNGKLMDPVVTYSKGSSTVEEIVFTNTYKVEASEPLALQGTKKLTGADLKDGQFTFELYEASVEDGKLVKGDKLDEAVNEDGKFTFEGQVYDQVGEYYYIVTEKNDSQERITYDDNVFFVTVVVEDPGTGRLTASVQQIDAQEQTDSADMTFTNTYTPPAVTPDTGDDTPVFVYVGLMAFSVLALAVILLLRRKEGKKAF